MNMNMNNLSGTPLEDSFAAQMNSTAKESSSSSVQSSVWDIERVMVF